MLARPVFAMPSCSCVPLRIMYFMFLPSNPKRTMVAHINAFHYKNRDKSLFVRLPIHDFSYLCTSYALPTII
jgi:hypothetical protein